MDIESRIKELNAIAEKLEDKSITLDKSMELFNDAILKCGECIKALNEKEGKIQELVQELDGITKTAFEVE